MKFSKPIILASGSPRRKSLMEEAGIPFEIKLKAVDENFPAELKREEVAVFIAKKKASVYNEEVLEGYTVITADTIVCYENEILGKPKNEIDAFEMLKKLSGKKHEVITAVCIRCGDSDECFYVTTSVYFKELSNEEIDFYIKQDQPMDKAGAYGIQEWIGLVGIEKIEGSYPNVVGLPVHQLYQHLIHLNSYKSL